MLQHYWSLIIRLFHVISGHSLEESYLSAAPPSQLDQVYLKGDQVFYPIFCKETHLVDQ